MSVDILAFGAHPDDVEISCGGTLLRYRDEGKRIALVDLTQGELGTRGSAQLRMQECEASSQKLRLVDRVNLKMPDGFFEENDTTVLQHLSLATTSIFRIHSHTVLRLHAYKHFTREV